MRIRVANRRRARRQQSIYSRFAEVHPMGLLGHCLTMIRSEPIMIRNSDRISIFFIRPARKPFRAYTVIERRG